MSLGVWILWPGMSLKHLKSQVMSYCSHVMKQAGGTMSLGLALCN